MALQRKNFRCPRDGSASPVRAPASPSSGAVISHAELPPRQRKRLQVGATNLCKSPSSAEFEAGKDDLDAARRVCATNIELLRATVPTAVTGNDFRIGESSGERTPGGDVHVVRTEFRRLHSMTLSSSASRLEAALNTRTPHGARTTLTRLTAISTEAQSPQATINGVDTAVERDAKARHREQSDTKAKKQRAQFVKNRRLLYEAFVKKYGSMHAVFKAFDSDGDGVISFQRFFNMVEASEVGLSPEETRAMYAHVDTNGDNAMEYQEFAQMFVASEAGSFSSGKTGDDDCITSDPGSSHALKYRSPLELSPRSRERMKELRSKVNVQLAELHGLDVSIHGGKNEQLLMHAFKQFDTDNDGVLSYEQVKSALGKDFLKLQMHPNEMEEMVRMIDRNSDELISMKEFVQYFGVGKREIPTDLLDNGRKKALTVLHQKMNAKLTPREEADPNYFAKCESIVQREETTRGVFESTGCLPESLTKRIAAEPLFQTPPSPSRVLSGSKSVPTLGSLRGRSSGGGREGLSPSRGPEVNPISPVDQDRFQHRRKQRTDWTRVGLGGDGVARDSGLFLSDLERFRTTTGNAYSPMQRGQNSGDLSREQPATSSVEFAAREKIRQARFERAQTHLQEYAASRVQEERLRDWRQRAKVREAAGRQFGYLDRIQDQEQRVAMKDLQPQKRHGGVRYLRMWAGSPDSQFNELRVAEDEA